MKEDPPSSSLPGTSDENDNSPSDSPLHTDATDHENIVEESASQDELEVAQPLSERWPKLYQAHPWLLIVAAVVVAWWTALPCGYVWVDHIEYQQGANRLTEPGDFVKLWTNTLGQFSFRQQGALSSEGDYWRPLQTLSFTLDWALWGDSPFWSHLENLLLHLLICFGLYRLARRLLSGQKYSAEIALMGTLCFAVSPINAQSVTWVSGRKDLLCILFCVSSLLCYTKLQDRKKIAVWFPVGLICLLAALLSKELAVVLPLVFLLLSWHRLDWELDGGREPKRRPKKKKRKRRRRSRHRHTIEESLSEATLTQKSVERETPAPEHLDEEKYELESESSDSELAEEDELAEELLASQSYVPSNKSLMTSWFVVSAFVLVGLFVGYRYFVLGGFGLNAHYPAETIFLNIVTCTRLWWHNVGVALWPWQPSLADSWTVSREFGQREQLSLAGAGLWLVALLVLRFRKQGWMLWWFTIWMLPASGILPIRHWRAERYLYPASFGIILLAVMTIYYLPMMRPRWKRNRITFRKSLKSKERYTIRVGLSALVISLAFWTAWQNNY